MITQMVFSMKMKSEENKSSVTDTQELADEFIQRESEQIRMSGKKACT